MKISSSWLSTENLLLSGIEQLDLRIGAGGTRGYRFSKSYRVNLTVGEKISVVFGTEKAVQRETMVKLLSGSVVKLSWSGMEAEDEIAYGLSEDNPIYRDSADGGLQLSALAIAEDAVVSVVLRQEQPFEKPTNEEREEIMSRLYNMLLVDTEIPYGDALDDQERADQVYSATGSDDGTPGYKAFAAFQVSNQEPISYNIDASQVDNAGSNIVLQKIRLFHTAVCGFLLSHTEDDLYDTFIETWTNEIYGMGTIFKFVAKSANPEGGVITFKPDFPLIIGRFIAKNPETGSSDTCIITKYKPNIDNPEQGGTFTLKGY